MTTTSARLKLGALPPYDIYRSESELASRKVAVIQQEYSLKQAEDALRVSLGADLDPNVGALDLSLVEQAEPSGDLLTLDISQAIQRALAKRPELESQRLLVGCGRYQHPPRAQSDAAVAKP